MTRLGVPRFNATSIFFLWDCLMVLFVCVLLFAFDERGDFLYSDVVGCLECSNAGAHEC